MKGNTGWEEKFRQEFETARRHVACCIELYRYQMSKSRFFLHEHPWSASSWKLWEVDTVAQDEMVHVVRSDLCRFGMVAYDESGVDKPARKRTGFMTNSWVIAEGLAGDCGSDHGGRGHQLLIGGRAAA